MQHAGSVVEVHGLWSAGSAVVAHGLSCRTACGSLPDQGLNLSSLHWQGDFHPLGHQGSPLSNIPSVEKPRESSPVFFLVTCATIKCSSKNEEKKKQEEEEGKEQEKE